MFGTRVRSTKVAQRAKQCFKNYPQKQTCSVLFRGPFLDPVRDSLSEFFKTPGTLKTLILRGTSLKNGAFTGSLSRAKTSRKSHEKGPQNLYTNSKNGVHKLNRYGTRKCQFKSGKVTNKCRKMTPKRFPKWYRNGSRNGPSNRSAAPHPGGLETKILRLLAKGRAENEARKEMCSKCARSALALLSLCSPIALALFLALFSSSLMSSLFYLLSPLC